MVLGEGGLIAVRADEHEVELVLGRVRGLEVCNPLAQLRREASAGRAPMRTACMIIKY